MKIQNPYFSVIIPCYNSYNYIEKALDEFNKQQFSNFEVVCIDDCSSDNTFNYLKAKENAYNYQLVVTRNKDNFGPGRTRSHGLLIAKGKYICFCDSDDWFMKDSLTILYNKLIETNADLCFFNVNRVFKSGNTQNLQWLKDFSSEFTKTDYLAHATDSLCSIVVRKELISSINLPTSYNCEDGPAVVAMTSLAKKITYVKEPLYCYLHREQSLSTNINVRILQGFIDAYHYLKNFEISEYHDSFELQYIKYILYGYTLNAIKLGHHIEQIYHDISFYFDENPQWMMNPYLRILPFRKRIWIWAIRHKYVFLLKLYLIMLRFYYYLRLL